MSQYEKVVECGLVVDVGDLVPQILGKIKVRVGVKDFGNARPVCAHTTGVCQKKSDK